MCQPGGRPVAGPVPQGLDHRRSLDKEGLDVDDGHEVDLFGGIPEALDNARRWCSPGPASNDIFQDHRLHSPGQ